MENMLVRIMSNVIVKIQDEYMIVKINKRYKYIFHITIFIPDWSKMPSIVFIIRGQYSLLIENEISF